jgi:hypothetical protein
MGEWSKIDTLPAKKNAELWYTGSHLDFRLGYGGWPSGQIFSFLWLPFNGDQLEQIQVDTRSCSPIDENKLDTYFSWLNKYLKYAEESIALYDKWLIKLDQMITMLHSIAQPYPEDYGMVSANIETGCPIYIKMFGKVKGSKLVIRDKPCNFNRYTALTKNYNQALFTVKLPTYASIDLMDKGCKKKFKTEMLEDKRNLNQYIENYKWGLTQKTAMIDLLKRRYPNVSHETSA